MKDEKEMQFEENENEEALESSLDKSDNYEQETLNDELEKLAETFRTELKKAKEQGEVKVSENEVVDENDNVIPKEELCECCGERRKDTSVSQNYAYCSECRELMKRYPLNFSSVVVALAIILVAVFGVAGFVSDFSGYNSAKIANDADRENKKFSAVEYYVDACSFFEEKELVPKKLYRDSAENIFSTLPEGVASFNQVAEIIDLALSDFEAKLPIYNGYENLRDKSLTMYNTFNAFYAILNNIEYQNLSVDDKDTILKVYKETGDLIGKELTIKSMTGEDITVVYDEAAVLFSQFMFAYSYEEFDKAYDCLKKLNELYPEHISMFGYELAILEIQSGNFKEANSLADKLIVNNAEDSSPYGIYTYSYRMKGNYKKSLEYAEKGLEINKEDSDLYRQKAITLLLQGEAKEAQKVIEEGSALGEYAVMYYTYLIIANEAGDTDKVTEIQKILDDAQVETPEKVQKYLDGKLSYKKLFTEGTGDIQ
ncbi:MAG: hypothetical protein E7556_03095 [Ruminococcaceae bacterium]|nr:hypothetical protein [Oscillospiraceae bacterium]